jgi:long-chain acyl-CoA synthetase
MGNQHNN